MDITVIEAHVKAIRSAKDNGILDIYSDNKIQVSNTLFEKLLNEKGSLVVKETEYQSFPMKAEFMKNRFTYFSLYTAQDFKNTFGGNIDECITTK
ncbi:hypothetical protein J0813_24255 [Bacillus pacificus]|uniref:hypothetical protein n=1 Tax=Bacillus pacificus TaxID=2026187 RepID=UPI002FDB99CD